MKNINSLLPTVYDERDSNGRSEKEKWVMILKASEKYQAFAHIP
jgi:hypothetical protein